MSGAYRGADATVPGYRGAAVTPSDTIPLECTRALYVGGTGTLKITFADGGAVTFTNVASGTLLPIQAVLVWDTGTTASDIVAIY